MGLVVVAAVALGLWHFNTPRETVDVVSASAVSPGATPAPSEKAPTTAPSNGEIPGKGVVDVPLGEMRPMDPPKYEGRNLVEGQPVKVAGRGGDIGWIAWSDFAVNFMPVDPLTPYPMVPIRDEKGQQIAWWAKSLGWVSFETVSAPGYDYRKAYEDFYNANTPSCEDLNKLDSNVAC